MRCALPADRVAEVARAVAVQPLPGAPLFVAGTIDVHGTPTPVLDVRVRLGRAPRPPRLSDRIVIVQTRGRHVALWVDEIFGLEDVAEIPAGEREALFSGDRSVAGLAHADGGLVVVHDVDGFITESQAEVLAGMVAR